MEKFAINSLISATHTAEMDEEDRKDIIKKINSAGNEDDNSDNEDDNQDDTSDDSDNTGDGGDEFGGDLGSDEDNADEDLQELSVYEAKLNNLFVNPKKNNMFQPGSNDILNENEGAPTRYMFFSNLEQMARQAGLLLEMDQGQIEAILNSGHDWAADHIAEAKNNMDQVFDFLMNETKGDDDEVDYSEWSKPMEVSSDIPVSSDLAYHIQNEIALGESVFRYGSDKFMSLLKEVKSLYEKGLIKLNENDEFIVNDFDNSYIQVGEDKIKMNFIFESIEEGVDVEKIDDFLLNNGFNRIALANLTDDKKIDEFLFSNGYNKNALLYMSDEEKLNAVNEILSKETLNEAEYQGKKVEIGKPKRGGSKKFYVYVRNPKTGKVKKVSFGAKSGGGNLAVKLKDPKARKAFADRHNCEQKNDKTQAGYWSCRLPRYAKLLGLSGGGRFW